MVKFGQSTENKSRIINRRMFMLSSVKLLVFGGILGRLFYLQISENIKYTSLSEKKSIKRVETSIAEGSN